MLSNQSISPEATARRLIDEGFNQGHLEVADELIASGVRRGTRAAVPGIPGLRRRQGRRIATLRRAFSDFQLTTQEVAIVGDRVWMRNVATGTHDGPFMGHAATGRSIQITVFDVMRVVDGRILEHWGVADQASVLLQIGALRPPGPV